MHGSWKSGGLGFEASPRKNLGRPPSQQTSQMWLFTRYPCYLGGVVRRFEVHDWSRQKIEILSEKQLKQKRDWEPGSSDRALLSKCKALNSNNSIERKKERNQNKDAVMFVSFKRC
jgi:hypothetical protein